jgi:hypothetical protein
MAKNTTSKKKLDIRPKVKKEESNEDLKCEDCRHANQKTDDHSEGLVACKFNGGMRLGKSCDVTFPMKDGEYYMYEAYDGSNCTWMFDGDFVITSE